MGTPPKDPPPLREHHVRLPDEAARILGAAAAHARGLTGSGIRVAVIDSGFYPHPFYLARGYNIRLVPTRAEPEPGVDEYGHGTAQLASLFAIAPAVEALAIKCLDRDPCPAIRRALELEPDVLSVAWGFNIDHPRARRLPAAYRRLYRLLDRAVAKGVCVVAAAGNGQRSFPGCMPQVISAGGVFYTPEGEFEPSDVSSRYESALFPSRQIPDVCGLVGNLPHGRLLLVPVPPRARLARRQSFGLGTAPSALGVERPLRIPGWAMFSGTSAATAMVSGAVALLRQARHGISPEEVKRVLLDTARALPESGCRVLDVEAALRAAGREK
jgi:subtilisin family serine protease